MTDTDTKSQWIQCGAPPLKSLEDQLAAARRELKLRESTYPRWIAQGKTTAAIAQHEIDCMRSIVATVERAKLLREVSEEIAALAAKME
jgi:hypothetical protein